MKTYITLTKHLALIALFIFLTTSIVSAANDANCCREKKLCCKTALAVHLPRYTPSMEVKHPDFKIIRVVMVTNPEPIVNATMFDASQKIDFRSLSAEMEQAQETLSMFTPSLKNTDFDLQMDQIQAVMSSMKEEKQPVNSKIDFTRIGREMDAVQEEMSRLDLQ